MSEINIYLVKLLQSLFGILKLLQRKIMTTTAYITWEVNQTVPCSLI